ncbi:MAG: hypothetical protein KIG67_03000 [Bacteroidales bacterium]|nr:hypothetical protein [Bacteroidales bacterium]
MMKSFFLSSLIALSIVSCTTSVQDTVDYSYATDLMTDTWVATDALGRTMPGYEEVGPVKNDQRRIVGIFYITWHTQGLKNLPQPYEGDVTKVLEKDPSARMIADHPNWKLGSYHWGEPENGYFLSQDEWVIRKDMSMLADAGVDVLVMDVTNAVLYWDEWEVTFSTMMKMREEGNKTPQFCFWAFNGNVISVVQQLYEKFYKEPKYQDLWFYWDGKPLLLYNAEPELDANGGWHEYKDGKADYSDEVKQFFTLRNMWWGYYEWNGKRFIGTEDNWSFGYSMADSAILAMSPDELVSKHNGRLEEAAVTPAQHPVTMTKVPMGVGKSWSREFGQPKLNEYDMPDSAYVPWLGKTVADPTGYGIYFQERWDDALKSDPEFIYLNDWNEWTAGKYNGEVGWLGRQNPFMFVDQYNAEFNRTISPMKGGYTDNYYMQMAQNIRRYKGVRPIPENKGYNRVTVDGDFADWAKVKVEYRDTRGDTAHRDAYGYANIHYTDSTGRNDILMSKVAVDADNVSFYVETAEDITPSTDSNWMLLLIDSDRNSSTGWYGYDILINKNVTDASTSEVLAYVDGQWTKTGTCSYAVAGNKLELSVAKSLLGVDGKEITFDFKWADNPSELEDPISLCLHGDTAPNRRFNYRFIWKK